MNRKDSLVAVGASAGGPAALATFLHGLPKRFSAAVIVVQHLHEQFTPGLATWLGQHSALPVHLASERSRVTSGVVLLASTQDHLVLQNANRVGYTKEPAENVYRPSIDVFFQSVAERWRADAVGVLLTGMGSDGALGLKAMRDKGYYTIAQDEASSAVYGMPKAAAKLEAAVDILPIDRIAPKLVGYFAQRGCRSINAEVQRDIRQS